ncbi:MAG TPA: hypothetical protein VN646_04640 [Candidatus Acidoferrum sp.]|jgi:hypothetical protein|nr:hypothetical protein [Candidatus Acidoferrum sp.]
MLGSRPLAAIAVRCAVLGGVVSLAAVPVYVYVEPSWRTLVARLAGALVLGVALLQLRRALVERIAGGGASALDEARRRRGPEPAVPHHFLDLTRDVRAALRSRRYFDEVLWPRLAAFTSGPLVRPPVRRGRGPSLASLREVISRIEQQP